MTDEVLTTMSPRPAAPSPERVSQVTAVEQSRAVAEVQAAVYVARQFPRDVATAVEAMREACAQPALANRAFFRYSRGGQAISGPSIHLARELARVWGNVQYGISELHRDPGEGQSEMVAFAWDMQINTRSSSTFIVPHAIDTKKGRKDLTELRDVYENNANQGARRVREAIFAVLPDWFTEDAKALCMRTMEDGGGKPLVTRIADAVRWFDDAGVRLTQLEDRLGRPRAEWRPFDVAHLEVVARSLRVGETTIGDEFPPAHRVTTDDLMAPPPDAENRQAIADDIPVEDPPEEPS